MSNAAMRRFLSEYPEALNDGAGAVFIGAGLSMSVGYPSWTALLRDIGEELGVASTDIQDLAALAQWSIQESGGATRVRSLIRSEIGVERPIPDALQVIARLPIKHLWTTNYDRLIERSFSAIDRPLDAISGAKDLALKARPGASRLYKMHGSVDQLDGIVISTDDYELFRSRRGAYLPLLQAHLTSMSMLFVGLSFSDPNIKHVLSLIRESFTDAPPEHFAIVRPPQAGDFDSRAEYQARLTQHNLWSRDLKRYGLLAVEVDDYNEVPGLLRQVERRVASRRVWISGSWPVDEGGRETARIYSLAEAVGARIGQEGLDLISGTGLIVGAAAVSGFLGALRDGGGWDLDRRLITRPFPQPLHGRPADRTQWSALRMELARQAGSVIFLGGGKRRDGAIIPADGVREEMAIAMKVGAFLLPIGSSGGAAKEISDELIGSSVPDAGISAARPTDEELRTLSDESMDEGALIDFVFQILRRITHAG